MTTTAVRMYGKTDLRLERFDLPAPGDDEILAHIISDSLCMSSYKAAVQGSDHKRVPADIDRQRRGQMATRVRTRPTLYRTAGAQLSRIAGRAGLFLPVHRRRRDLHRDSQRGDGDGLPLALRG